MNSRRQKIWRTEDEILAVIDRTKLMAQRRLKKSQELEEKAREKFGECEKLRFELMTLCERNEYQRQSLESKLRSLELSAAATKEKADKVAAVYHRAMNSTLPRLGEILAAFRTQPMKEILGEYKAVAIP